jgi:hypothetical protein
VLWQLAAAVVAQVMLTTAAAVVEPAYNIEMI